MPILFGGKTSRTRRAPAPRPAEPGLPPEAVLAMDAYIHGRARAKARQALRAGLEVDDLVQEGRAGALHAARKFDPTAGTRFLTYAAWWIEAAMGAALQRSLVPTPQGHAHSFVCSLDEPLHESQSNLPEGDTAATSLEDPAEDPHTAAVFAEETARLHRALPTLDPRTREVLLHRVGLGERVPQKGPALAARFGISRQRVGQIEQRGLAQLRAQLLGPART